MKNIYVHIRRTEPEFPLTSEMIKPIYTPSVAMSSELIPNQESALSSLDIHWSPQLEVEIRIHRKLNLISCQENTPTIL